MSISAVQARAIYEFFQYRPCVTLQEFQGRFCAPVYTQPDLSAPYCGKVLVQMSFAGRGSQWSARELMYELDYQKLPRNQEIYLGEIAGKHSQVSLTLEEMEDGCIRDPCEIFNVCGPFNDMKFHLDGPLYSHLCDNHIRVMEGDLEDDE